MELSYSLSSFLGRINLLIRMLKYKLSDASNNNGNGNNDVNASNIEDPNNMS